MLGRRLTLFRLLGFKINVDLSWILLAVLVTWSLSTGYFPFQHQALSQETYWIMGASGALGLFASIIFHELSHSVVARAYGMSISGITLFIFGGVAEMENEPPSAKSEFLMAIAGPIASLILALGFYQTTVIGDQLGVPVAVLAVTEYLALLNGLLAAFNMIPAFPLDGGRALRAALWGITKDLRGATKRAAGFGLLFGLVLIGGGVFAVVTGNLIAGAWWILIGFFLRNAADSSLSDSRVRELFEGETVERFMTRDVVTVPPTISLRELVEEYIYRHHFDLFPVTQGDQLLGCITASQVRPIPKERWETITVGDLLIQCTPDVMIEMREDAINALALMRRTGNGRLLVTDNGKLVGILVLKDMLELLALKMDLEGL